MQGSPGEHGENSAVDPDSPSKHPSKHRKGKAKGWAKVSWFKRRTRSGENMDDTSGGSSVTSPRVSGGSSVTSPRVSGHSEDLGSAAEGHEADFSPGTSTSSCSPDRCHSLFGSTSSSETDLYDKTLVDGSIVRRSKLYPNSEIVEQKCLKPSLTRALFLQLELWRSRLDGGNTSSKPLLKYPWQKKKSECVRSSSQEEQDTLTRTTSMPMGITLNKCHCAACCCCSPRERLEGSCPAFSKLNTSTTSLDTGLASLGFSTAYNPLVKRQSPQNFTESSSLSSSHQPQSPDVAKCNSLPSHSSSSPVAPRVCPICNKTVPLASSPVSCDTSPIFAVVPTSSASLQLCQCQAKICPTTFSSSHHGNKNQSVAFRFDDHDAEDISESYTVSAPRVGPSEFKERSDVIKQWFSEFSDEQKNLVLEQLLVDCDLPQLHMLSLEMEPRLHANCPPNCLDRLSWLPQPVAHLILSFLDPVSLCQVSLVCHQWHQLANEAGIWKRFCAKPKWRLSRAAEEKQLLMHMSGEDIQWKNVFAERYRVRNNWLRGRCNVRTFEGHTQGISCVQFDDTRIVSGSSDKTIKVWNIRTNNPWAVQTLVGHSGTVRCLHLDGNRLVSGSTDKTIKVWDLSTQQSWSSIACKVTMVGHTDTVRCLQVDQEKVISGSYDKTLKVWDIRTGLCTMTLRGHEAAVLCVQFDGSKIVSGSCDKTIKVWTFDGNCSMTLGGHHDAVTCLQFDTTRIFSGSLDCNLKFWDIHSGHCVNTIDWKASEGHTGVVRCLQADSWRVVSASDDRTLKVWSLETGQRLTTLRNHTDGVTCLQFNDSIIVSGSYDKTVKLWDFGCC